MSTIKSSAENLTLNADGANNDIIFQSNGSTKATLDQAGSLSLSGNLTSLGIDDNADATAMTINSSENVGFKQTNPSREVDVVGLLHAGADAGGTAGSGGGVTIGELAAGSISGDSCYVTRDGGNLLLSPRTNSTVYGIKMFAGQAERCRVTSNGLTFNGDTAADNALDDYEEGSWTPVFKDSNNSSIAGTLVNAIYTKIGRLVTVMIYFEVTNLQNGYLNTMTLPFTQTGSGRGAGSITTYNCPIPEKSNAIYLNGGSKVAFWKLRDNATSLSMQVVNGSELMISITYMAA